MKKFNLKFNKKMKGKEKSPCNLDYQMGRFLTIIPYLEMDISTAIVFVVYGYNIRIVSYNINRSSIICFIKRVSCSNAKLQQMDEFLKHKDQQQLALLIIDTQSITVGYGNRKFSTNSKIDCMERKFLICNSYLSHLMRVRRISTVVF